MLTDQLLEKLLLGVIAGLFGLVPVIVQLVAARSQAKSRNNEVARLGAELEFLTKLDTLSRAAVKDVPVPPPVVGLHDDLARLLSDYRAIRPFAIQHPGPGTLSFVSRLFLLFRPHSAPGWLLHTVFYFLVIFVAVGLITDLQSPTFDPQTGENQFKYLVLGLVILVGPPLFLLRRAALKHR